MARREPGPIKDQILSHLLVTLTRARMTCMSIILNWNGEEIPEQVRKQMPAELQRLPPGRYVLDAIDEVPELTAEEEAGIHAAMESVRQGKVVSLEVAKARIDRILVG